MFRKVRKFCKKHQDRLIEEIYAYEAFVNVEDSTMEFDMDSTPGGQGDERIAFGPMAKGQKRYGSTAVRHMKDDSNGFAYSVQPGDTLQGLAVKFGITTEQLRRSNQLWTNDSLFLRDKLIIPVLQLDNGHHRVNGQSSTSSVSSSVGPSSSTTTNGSSVKPSSGNQTGPKAPTTPDLSYPSPEPMSTSSKPWTHPLSDSFEYDDGLTTPESIKLDTDTPPSPNLNMPYASNGVTSSDYSDKTASEFLSRIDIAIASTKHKTLPALNQNGGTAWVTFESDSESDAGRSGGTTLLVQGRHLRHSLRKLEKKQEELFQL